MRVQDIKIGEHYRFKAHPHYSVAKAIAVLRPRQGENKNTFSVVKCEHTIHAGDKFGFIRYLRPSELIKQEATCKKA